MTRHFAGRRPRAAWARLALGVLLVVACSRNKQEMENDEFLRVDPIPIHVKNENFADVNVAVIAGGISRRLGQVVGNGTGDFQINWSVANGQSIYLSATPIGGRGNYVSQGLSLQPGQAVEFLVGSVLRQSNAVIRTP